MKYKVGDKVRIVNKRTRFMNDYGEMDKYLGKVMTIAEIIDSNKYRMKEDNEEWCWDNEMIKGKINFTKSDLQEGDIVTYRDSHKAVVGINKLKLYGVNEATMMYLADYDEKLNYKTGGHKDTINDIVKVERPTQYETVFEHKEEILDEAEKRYLRAVIRPFRNEIDFIRKEGRK